MHQWMTLPFWSSLPFSLEKQSEQNTIEALLLCMCVSRSSFFHAACQISSPGFSSGPHLAKFMGNEFLLQHHGGLLSS
jgi:hypothetical protein